MQVPKCTVYGNMVNVTSRMATTAPIGTVQVTEEFATYLEQNSGAFTMSVSKDVSVKGKGVMRTRLVEDVNYVPTKRT